VRATRPSTALGGRPGRSLPTAHSSRAWQRSLRAEQLRAASIPAPWALVAVATVIATAFTALAITNSGRAGTPAPTTTLGAAQLLTAGSSAVLFATLVGVVSATAELRHGTVLVTLVADPNRRRWLAAKVAVAAAIGGLAGGLAQIGTLAVGIPMLAQRHAALASIWNHLLWSSLGTCAVGALAAAWGVGIGCLVRNQVAAVVVTVVWTVIVEPVVLAAAPVAGRFLPGGATAALTLDPTVLHRLVPGWGLLLWVGWATLLVAVGGWACLGGDVPSGV